MERGAHSWDPMVKGLRWLGENDFTIHLAGRTYWNEDDASLRDGYRAMIANLGLNVDADDPMQMVLFPEMDEKAEVPEITTDCWGILGVDPKGIMCASSRMVVKRKGADKPAVVACTLLPYDEQFETGATLKEASGIVKTQPPPLRQVLRPWRGLLQQGVSAACSRPGIAGRRLKRTEGSQIRSMGRSRLRSASDDGSRVHSGRGRLSCPGDQQESCD